MNKLVTGLFIAVGAAFGLLAVFGGADLFTALRRRKIATEPAQPTLDRQEHYAELIVELRATAAAGSANDVPRSS